MRGYKVPIINTSLSTVIFPLLVIALLAGLYFWGRIADRGGFNQNDQTDPSGLSDEKKLEILNSIPTPENALSAEEKLDFLIKLEAEQAQKTQ